MKKIFIVFSLTFLLLSGGFMVTASSTQVDGHFYLANDEEPDPFEPKPT